MFTFFAFFFYYTGIHSTFTTGATEASSIMQFWNNVRVPSLPNLPYYEKRFLKIESTVKYTFLVKWETFWKLKTNDFQNFSFILVSNSMFSVNILWDEFPTPLKLHSRFCISLTIKTSQYSIFIDFILINV